jgi:hypothetical protein
MAACPVEQWTSRLTRKASKRSSATDSVDNTVKWEDGFIPNYGDEFQIMTLAARSGEFDTINGVVVDARHALALIYNDFDITVTMALPGDINLDGQVDGLDLNILAPNLQAGGTDWSTGDLNGDGVTNGLDLNILSAN